MGQKVTFDPINKIIQVTAAPVGGVVELDVKIDLYSDMKEDWKVDPSLFKYRVPIRSVGGDALPGSKALGATFFLDPPWVIRPYEQDHRLVVNGNLYREDGSSPFTTTIGNYNVLIESVVSSLVDSTVQQLSEIEAMSYVENSVWVDVTSVNAGASYPNGNGEYPVNNIPDAVAIANDRGLHKLAIIGDLTLDAGDNVDGFEIVGQSPSKTMLTINPASSTVGCEIHECMVTGTLDGDSEFRMCVVQDIYYVNGYMYKCLLNPGTITLGNNSIFFALDCYSGVPGTGTPTIDMGGSGQSLAMRGYNGGIKLINKNGPESLSIDLNSGQVKLESATISNAGTLVFRGVGKVIDADTGEFIHTSNWNGCTIINETVNGVHQHDMWRMMGLDPYQPITIGNGKYSAVDLDVDVTDNGNGTYTLSRN